MRNGPGNGGKETAKGNVYIYQRQEVELTEAHGVIGTLGNGEDVGRDLVPPLPAVQADSPVGVDGEPLVRVHRDTEQARVGLQWRHVACKGFLYK